MKKIIMLVLVSGALYFMPNMEKGTSDCSLRLIQNMAAADGEIIVTFCAHTSMRWCDYVDGLIIYGDRQG